MFQSVVIETVS